MQPPPPLAATPGAEPSGKPKWFSAITIIAIVLTSVGILMNLGGLASALLSNQILSGPFGSSSSGATPEMTRALEDMQAKMRELTMPWVTGTLAGLNIAACTWGLWTAIRVQGRKPGSTRGFGHAMTALGVAEIVSLVGGLYLQVRTMTVMREMFDHMRLGATPGAPANVDEIMRGTMIFSLIVGIAFALGWGALKIVFCFYARHYVTKPEVRAWIG